MSESLICSEDPPLHPTVVSQHFVTHIATCERLFETITDGASFVYRLKYKALFWSFDVQAEFYNTPHQLKRLLVFPYFLFPAFQRLSRSIQ